MAKINKNDIVDYVSEEAYLSRKDARAALDSIFEIISEALAAGSEVDIRDFGAFVLKERKPKMINSFKSNQKELVESHKTVTLRMSKKLKEKVNGK